MLTEQDNHITHERGQPVHRHSFIAWLKDGDGFDEVQALIINGTLKEIFLFGRAEKDFADIEENLRSTVYDNIGELVCEWDNFKTVLIK